MRILYLHPDAWTGEYPLLRRLRELGHEVRVLEEDRGMSSGKRRRSADFRRPGDGIATLWYHPGRGIERLATWPLDRVFRRAFDGRNLVHRMSVVVEAERLFRPDAIVCSDGYSYGIPAALAARLGLVRARLVVGYIGGDILDCPEAEYGRRRTPMIDRLIRASLQGADVLRPVSPLLAEALAAEGAPAGRVHVVPSHLALEGAVVGAILRERTAVSARVRARHGIAADAPLAVTLSNNQKGKGMHVMAEAWARVHAQMPQARWLLCGPEHPWLRAQVWPRLERDGARSSVVAAGALRGTEVFEHLAAGEVNVNPTLCEGLNMVVAEAAAVGTPSITSDGAGIAHWVSAHHAGRVVPRAESGPLADAILSAFRNPAELGRWSSASPALALDFSLDRVASQMLALCRPASERLPA